MRIEQNYSLEKHNTFHLPVKTRWFMEYETEEELQRILHDEYFQECLSLHIGGGSNLLFINDYNALSSIPESRGFLSRRKRTSMYRFVSGLRRSGMMSWHTPYRKVGEV